MLNHSNQKTLKQTDQKKNLTRQIHKKNNQKDQETLQNENDKEIIIVLKTDLHVICNEKEDNRMTSQ